jgi:hypothetical protein
MAIAWSKVFSFLGQHAATGFAAVGAAQAAGVSLTPQEMAAMFASAAIAGGVNHTRETATVTTPPPAPEPPPAVDAPPVVPVRTREQRYRDRVDDIYVQELGRPTDSEAERYQSYLLLEAGQEDNLRTDLRNRK